MKKVDARGDACPIPVVKAKHAIEELSGAGQVEVLVDNEIAVQNLTKMAEQKGYQSSAKKLADQEYQVIFTVGEQTEEEKAQAGAGCEACIPDSRTDTVVVIANDKMGEGSEELGKTLLKAFTFALTQQDNLPKTILFYNGGASLTCGGSEDTGGRRCGDPDLRHLPEFLWSDREAGSRRCNQHVCHR